MELNDVYSLTNIINEKIEQGEFKRDCLDDFIIVVKVSPSILHGIDKEFYRLSNNGSMKNFKHSEEVNARIDGVEFQFIKDTNNMKES